MNLDILIVLFYLILVMSLGFYTARSTSERSERYFFADRNLTWFLAALSLFATSLTGNQILVIIGMSDSESLVPGQIGAIAALALLILGWFFAPSFFKERISTAPEYLEKKYNRQSRKFFAVFSIIFYSFIRLSVTLIAAGIILSKLLAIDPFTASQIIVILTGIYVIIGGFSAVAYTHAVQSVFILLSIFAITILGVYKVGDMGIVWDKLNATSSAVIQPLFYSNWNELVSFFGGLIIGLWFWCTDQFVIQRIVSIKNSTQAKNATLLAGFLHIVVILLLILITISAGIIYANRSIHMAFSRIIVEMNMQTGLNGIILSGALALLMASLAGLFSSIATIFTFDFSRDQSVNTSERKVLLKGRLITLGVVIFSILWIPVIRFAPDIIISLIIKIPVFCAPVIAAVFLFARKTPGHILGSPVPVMILGCVFGLLYMAAASADLSIKLGSLMILSFADIPFMYYVIIIFVLSYLSLWLQNRKTAQNLVEKEKSVFKFNRIKELIYTGNSRFNNNTVNAALSVILALLVIGMWWVFKI